MSSESEQRAAWRIRVDTGGTFTDCVAVDPDGALHRVKVLSSSALRARVVSSGGLHLVLEAPWRLVEGFAAGARLAVLGESVAAPVHGNAATSGTRTRVALAEPLAAADRAGLVGARVELRFDEEAPILAARLATGAVCGDALPPLALRLATTRGTNALLERKGARTALLVTRGFGDLLTIGDQRRPDLFALDIVRPEPLVRRVVEVPERLAADGTVLEALDLDALRPVLEHLVGEVDAVAIALLHSWRDDRHELALEKALHGLGCRHVSVSSRLVPALKILPRAETAVVDAYLTPILDRYLRRVEAALPDRGPSGRVHVMTSAGGLMRAGVFRAKDSLLSGPAGGVVGAVRIGRELGHDHLLAFDMGGTSTDVARFGGRFDDRFEHTVGAARVAAPSLAIESVAAGGGSICRVDAASDPGDGEPSGADDTVVLLFGPGSAGADPGPACYGAGGPLTLTDVHLLLGRLDGRRFGIPVDAAGAERALDEVLAALPSGTSRDDVLQGFLDIADERMAAAVRAISVRRGYDPADHALVAFGGAGGLHACAVAALLGVDTVLLPRDAGLLSAVGLDAARLERIVRRPVLQQLDAVAADLARRLAEAEWAGARELLAEGVPEDSIVVSRRSLFMRLLGQESTLELELESSAPTLDALAESFRAAYRDRFGYAPPERALEIESLRVAVAEQVDEPVVAASAPARGPAPVESRHCAYLHGAWREVPVIDPSALEPGHHIAGPALVFGPHASFVLEPGWSAVQTRPGTLVARRD
ncbi:MAG: hydantoinase/oxoprolinase family protein [Acidobacteriota bacterium]